MRNAFSIAIFLAMAVFATGFASAGMYRYELFRADGAIASYGYGINNEGVIVGGVAYGANAQSRSGLTRSADGTLSIFNYPNQIGTQIHGINNLGQSIASYSRTNGGSQSFLIEGDGSLPLSFATEPIDINDSGQVAGGRYNEIYLWNPDGDHVWTRSGDYLFAGGVNNRGLVVYSIEGQEEDGLYRWRSNISDSVNGGGQPVEFPGAYHTFVDGINNRDQVIGTWRSLSRDAQGAFIRHADGAFEDLVPPAPGILQPTDINDLGQITGSFRPEGESITYAFLATPVPEPSSLVLMSACAVAVVAWKRRGRTVASE